jgi:hypothetical protein
MPRLTIRQAELLLLGFLPFPMIFASQSVTVALVCWLLAALVGLALLLELLGGPKHLRLSTVLATGLLIAYAGGGVVALVASMLVLGDPAAISIYGVDIADLNVAMAVVCFSMLPLLGFGLVEKPLSLVPERDISESRCLVIVAVLLGTVYLAFLNGNLSVGGVKMEGESLSAFASIAFALTPAGAAFSAYCMRQSKSSWAGMCFFLALLLFLMFMLPQGRRNFLYTLIVVGIYWQLDPRKHLTPIFTRRNLLLIPLTLMLGWFSVRFFYALRLARGSLGADPSLPEMISEAIDTLQTGSASEDLDALVAMNLTYRPLIIDYFGQLVAGALRGADWLGGQVLWNSILLAIPSTIFPSKPDFVVNATEIIANPAFGVPVDDFANSLLTEFFSDFLWVGLAFGPILVVLMLRLWIMLLKRIFSADLVLLAGAGMIWELVQAETTLSNSFTAMRQWLLCLALLSAVDLISRLFERRAVRPFRQLR